VRGANGRRVSRGRFRVVGCGAFRLGFDGGLGGEAEETALFLPVIGHPSAGSFTALAHDTQPVALITGLVALYVRLEPAYGVFQAPGIVGGVLAVIALVLISAVMIVARGRTSSRRH
jgi:hypothetical protein